jgi:MSHA biogenesis protein MshO
MPAVSSKIKGFTLIELIIVMVISSIIAMIGSQVISRPVTAYANLGQRTQLVDAADALLKKMIYELRAAFPNSIRIGCSGKCIEFLRTVDGGRYRRSAPGNVLSFDQSTLDVNGFEVLGDLSTAASITTSSNADHCRTGNAHCLVIYNTGQTNYDAYKLDNVATISNVTGPSTVIQFSFPVGKVAFPAASPGQRFHIVDTPISYLCDDTGSKTITRYQNYPITADHSDVDSSAEILAFAGTTSALVTNKVSSCNFSYSTGSSARSALLTIRLILSENMTSGNTESISLLQQAHIINTP